VRFHSGSAACDLRCSYCDTAYAFTEGKKKSLAEICAEVQKLAAPIFKPLPLINDAGLQPGDSAERSDSQPFQRLPASGKPLKRLQAERRQSPG